MKIIVITVLVIAGLLYLAPKETVRLGAAFFGLGKAAAKEVTVGQTGHNLRDGARHALDASATHVERAAAEARR